jgi:hypothetical protein
MRFAKIALAVAAVVAGPAAMAGTVLDPTQGPSDLLLVVWDSANNDSVVYNTGLSVDSTSNTNMNFAVTNTFSSIDTSLTQLTTDLGGAAQSTWQYAVLAANGAGTGFATQGYEFDATSNQPGSTFTAIQNQDALNGAAAISTYVSNNISGFSSSNVLVGNASNPNAQFKAGGAFSPGPNVGNTPVSVGASPGSSLSFYEIAASDDTPGDSPTVTQPVGSWNFSATNDQLVWSPVPLPASVWMLLSGLIGVGAISRRRAAGGALSLA